MSDVLDPGFLIADRYQVRGLLGRGGMGEVYRVVDRNTNDKPRAIKVVRDELLDNAQALQRFENEIRLLSRLNHPNVVDIIDSGSFQVEGSDRYFYAMEFISGRNLGELVPRAQSRGLRRNLELMRQLCQALAAVHRVTAHRDLKPANIMVIDDHGSEHLKLVDFGIAQMAREGTASRFTQQGMVLGTWSYMAPEQLTGDWNAGQIDWQVDVFALGIVLFEALTGRHPFGAAEAMDMAYRIRYEEPSPIENYLEEQAPPVVTDIIARCLAKDPGPRPSVTEVKQALDEGLEQLISGVGAQATAPVQQDSATIVAADRMARDGQLQAAVGHVEPLLGAQSQHAIRWVENVLRTESSPDSISQIEDSLGAVIVRFPEGQQLTALQKRAQLRRDEVSQPSAQDADATPPPPEPLPPTEAPAPPVSTAAAAPPPTVPSSPEQPTETPPTATPRSAASSPTPDAGHAPTSNAPAATAPAPPTPAPTAPATTAPATPGAAPPRRRIPAWAIGCGAVGALATVGALAIVVIGALSPDDDSDGRTPDTLAQSVESAAAAPVQDADPSAPDRYGPTGTETRRTEPPARQTPSPSRAETAPVTQPTETPPATRTATQAAAAEPAPSFSGLYVSRETGLQLSLESAPGASYTGYLGSPDFRVPLTARLEGRGLRGVFSMDGQPTGFEARFLSDGVIEVVDADGERMVFRRGDPSERVRAGAGTGAGTGTGVGSRTAGAAAGSRTAADTATAGPTVINGRTLTNEEIQALLAFGIQTFPGHYWYDPVSGAWGMKGGPTVGFLAAGIPCDPLDPQASNGTTGVYINGRQLPQADLIALQTLTGPLAPGRYFVDGQGNAGLQGGPPLINLVQAAQAAGGYGGGGGGGWSSPLTGASGNSAGGSGYVILKSPTGGSTTVSY